METRKVRVVEFFSGIGAQRAALNKVANDHNLDLEFVAQCDIDKKAVEAYNAIFGETPNLGNICEVERIPACDLATYSFPCTALSKAGRQEGMEEGSGTASSLLWEFKRILIDTPEDERPEWLVMENVPQVHGKKFRADFDKWINILGGLGYDSIWFDLNSKDCGVAQNRNRTFMVSRLRAKGRLFPVGPKKTPLNKVLRDYLEDDPVDEKYYLSYTQVEHLLWHNEKNRIKKRGFDFKPRMDDTVASCISTRSGSRETDNYVMCHQVADLNRPGWSESTQRVYDTDALSPTINTGQGGGHEVKVVIEATKDQIAVVNGTKQGYSMAEEGDGLVLGFYTGKSTARGRVQKGKCPTLQCGINAAVITRDSDGKDFMIRKLTPRECWRLFGRTDEEFDKVKAIGMSDSQLYKQAGNSIVVEALVEVFHLVFGVWEPLKMKVKRLDDFEVEL